MTMSIIKHKSSNTSLGSRWYGY